MNNLNYIHLNECHSTQETLKNQWEEGKITHPYLISTSKQTNGQGRRKTPWQHFPGSLAISFTWPLKEKISMVPLELGVFICEFFKERYQKNLYLKWPNDLLNQKNEKIGGIIMNLMTDILLVGIGINMFTTKERSHFPYKHAFIFDDKFELKEIFYTELYQYLLKRNQEFNSSIKEDWAKYCIHLNKNITIKDEFQESKGIFLGIGEHGEALISHNGKIEKVLSGSLFLN